MKKYDYAVFIGRFQPIHNGHIANINQALSFAESVIIVVGSKNKARDTRHPWSYRERIAMIRSALPVDVLERIEFVGAEDFIYNTDRWIENIQDSIESVVRAANWDIEGEKNPPKIALIGYHRDHTSNYLDYFPQWEFVPVDECLDSNEQAISSTAIRKTFYRAIIDNTIGNDTLDLSQVPLAVAKWLVDFSLRDNLNVAKQMAMESAFIQQYRSQYDGLKYAVIQQTVDAVVLISGHVLLVRRRAMPGKGLWAIPGGFINEFEALEDAAIRELKEETRVKLAPRTLREGIKLQKRYADPMRSTRGRTITEAFLFKFPAQPLPKVKGSSDAKQAKWFTLAEIDRMEDQLFEDHFHIIQDLVSRV